MGFKRIMAKTVIINFLAVRKLPSKFYGKFAAQNSTWFSQFRFFIYYDFDMFI